MFALTEASGAADTLTGAGILEEASTYVKPLVVAAGDFFAGLWANPMGKFIICLSVVSAIIGLGYRLFLRKKHV